VCSVRGLCRVLIREVNSHETVNMVASPKGLGPENDCAG
jgi:hypothetical protein